VMKFNDLSLPFEALKLIKRVIREVAEFVVTVVSV
jgi:hypothetical protein